MAESEMFSFVKEGEYELVLGNSLSTKKSEQDNSFHTVRYDFKPASIDSTKPGSLLVGDKNNVTIEVPNSMQDSGSTIYNGSKRHSQKEFLLIIDKKSQKFTLERIGSNMQVKKIRSGSVKPKPQPTTAKVNQSKAKTVNSKAKVSERSESVSSSQENKIETPEIDDTSSSSDNSSDSEDDNTRMDDNDEDDDEEIDEKHVEKLNSILNRLGPEPYKKPPEFNQLSQDLHLSESGSDSD